MKFSVIFVLLALTLSNHTATSAGDSTETQQISVDAYVDAYYSFAPNKAFGETIPFSITPTQNKTFAIAMITVGAGVNRQDYRGRVALQAGTTVDAAYTGSDTSYKNIQEAVVGVRIYDSLWIDAGVLVSHLGMESLRPADNWTFSRSLQSMATPYYFTGVKLSWKDSNKVQLGLFVINGWMTYFDDNAQKSIGTHVRWMPWDNISITWCTYLGIDRISGSDRMRIWNNAMLLFTPSEWIDFAAVADVGVIENSGAPSSTAWFLELMARWRPVQKLSIAARLERAQDPDEISFQTDSQVGFNTTLGSLTLDLSPLEKVLFRFEGRVLVSDDEMFRSGDSYQKSCFFLCSSLSIRF